MFNKRMVLPFIFIIFLNLIANAQSIRINELVSSNAQYTDEDGDTPDWFELYNYGSETIALNGWTLSDDSSEPDKWVFPEVSMIPGSFLRIWASSKDRTLSSDALHTNFKISSEETLLLFNPTGMLVHQITAAELPQNMALGISKTTNTLVTYLDTTPGMENSDIEYLGVIDSEVVFSRQEGVVDVAFDLVLSGNDIGQTIRYTTDSTVPTVLSPEFITPIPITENTVIRAAIFAEDYIPSPTQNTTYVFGNGHDIDLMFLTVTPDDFFDEDTGIYVYGPEGTYSEEAPHEGANFWEDWERPIYFSFYEKGNNTPAMACNAGVKIFGAWSRSFNQRSLSLFARSSYGCPNFEYPFFEELDYDKFEGLVLRNSGNDWLKTSIKDISLTSLMRGADIDFQEHNPVATYINGAYWGLYNMREKINEHMLASKHNLDSEDITLLTKDAEVIQGSNDEYNALIDYVSTTDLSDDQNFQYVSDRVDLMNYALYQTSNIFFSNTDWPGNNIKYWKHPNGKWRWILYDTDFGFGQAWNTDNYSFNTLDFALAINDSEWPNPAWSTLLFRRLTTNIGFRNLFINRYADELNTRFLPENIKNHIETIYQTVVPELEAHHGRWGGNIYESRYFVEEMKNFADNRPGYAVDHIMSRYDLPAYHSLEISNNNVDQGFVKINNNLKIQENTWTGKYFETVPIEIKAVPEVGYAFSHWSGDIAGTEATLTIDLQKAHTISANFKPASAELPIVINEINYKSGALDTDDWVELYNPNALSIDLSNWQLKDDDDSHVFLIPPGTSIPADGFMVLVKDAESFALALPAITNFVGDLGFGLGSQDAVRLYNADEVLQDEVYYTATAPWPECPDGTGQTLERQPNLDNERPENWDCISANGSPGRSNTAGLNTQNHRFSNLRIYPNPAGDYLYLSELSTITAIKVTNLTGQEVLHIAQPQQKIAIKSLPKGLYLLSIQDAQTSASYKFIKN